MSNIFSSIKLKKPKLNKFDLSHEKKLSLQMGKLVPMMCQEILPGDRFRVNSELMMRFAPMLAPIMHRVNVYTHYFFVPNRLLWNEWEDFITGGRLGTSEPVHPYLTINTANCVNGYFENGTLADYLGLPFLDATNVITQPLNISALPFRAYQTIFNEYYRDQNLSTEVAFGLGSGSAAADIIALTTLRQRAWEKDYFTSALPWAQRGSEVLMPMDGVATNANGDITWADAVGSPLPPSIQNLQILPAGAGAGTIHSATNEGPITIENIDEIRVTNATTTINDLRRSVRLQEWLEKNARGGARYIEQILSHFGVTSSDARLQRPEYLGGGKAPVVISEVLSTVNNAADTIPQGNMAGHGIAIGNTNGFSRRFEEHGYVVGIMSVIPRTAYQQGIPKSFLRESKLDYAWPEFAHLGEQEIYKSELYFNEAAVDHKTTFGYQSRYAEYKYQCSQVSGEFRSSLAYWHMGRIFNADPSLNESFISSDPTQRIFAVEDADAHKLYCQIYNNVSALRPLPYFGTPTL